MAIHDMVGIGGVVVYLLAYCLLQIRKLTLETYHYSLLNLMGSSMMLYSLSYTWNLSAAISSTSWALLSGMGLIKVLVGQKKTAPTTNTDASFQPCGPGQATNNTVRSPGTGILL